MLSLSWSFSDNRFKAPAVWRGQPTGPFYCPGDQQVYIDLSFFEDMQNKLNAPGDFAMAYVIAHEVGHHIQKLNGTSEKMHQLRQRLSEEEYNKYSVMLELQADFLAGVWAHHTCILEICGRKVA